MASVIANNFLRGLFQGEFNLATQDWRVMLLMTNTTVDTELEDRTSSQFISSFTTLDEFNGANYVRKALASETVTQNNTNERAEFSADNLTWTALGAGTRNIQGALLYRHVTNDADSIPVAWFEFTATPDGSDFTIRWNGGSTAGDLLRMLKV